MFGMLLDMNEMRKRTSTQCELVVAFDALFSLLLFW